MKPRKELLAERSMGQGETPDPTPIELPTELRHPGSLADTIRLMVARELAGHSHSIVNEEPGTWEEENDFDEDDIEDAYLSDSQLQEMERDFIDGEREFSLLEDQEPQEIHSPKEGASATEPVAFDSKNEAPTAQIPPE